LHHPHPRSLSLASPSPFSAKNGEGVRGVRLFVEGVRGVRLFLQKMERGLGGEAVC